jgi:hypothetical protein
VIFDHGAKHSFLYLNFEAYCMKTYSVSRGTKSKGRVSKQYWQLVQQTFHNWKTGITALVTVPVHRPFGEG